MTTANGPGFQENQRARSDAGFTARACASAYAVFVGVWVLPFSFFLYSALHGAKGAWLIAVLCASLLISFLLWLRSFRILILDTTISYRTLFGEILTLSLNQIEKAEIKVNTAEKFAPVWQLILWPVPISQKKPIVINMKVFSQTDLNRVFDALGPKLKTTPRFSLATEERTDLLRKIP